MTPHHSSFVHSICLSALLCPKEITWRLFERCYFASISQPVSELVAAVTGYSVSSVGGRLSCGIQFSDVREIQRARRFVPTFLFSYTHTLAVRRLLCMLCM
jgi:hypothetical protein